MNDDEIVLEIINKKEFALIELVNTYGKLIYGVINKILYTYVEANDIDECFNDILMSIWRNLDSYDKEKGSLTNFLISVAKYKAIDYKRKINKRGIDLELKDEIVDAVADNNLEVDNEEFINLLRDLNDEDKKIFIKKYLLCEPIEKISNDMGLNREVVYKRIRRGREKIRKNMVS